MHLAKLSYIDANTGKHHAVSRLELATPHILDRIWKARRSLECLERNDERRHPDFSLLLAANPSVPPSVLGIKTLANRTVFVSVAPIHDAHSYICACTYDREAFILRNVGTVLGSIHDGYLLIGRRWSTVDGWGLRVAVVHDQLNLDILYLKYFSSKHQKLQY